MASLKAVLAFGLAALAHPIKPGDDLTVSAIRDAANANKTPKYFVEPDGGLARRHYDLRFFKDEVRYDEHHDILRELIRSYLATMDKYGMETWLAHGTLLGWWWNGQIFPWDDDIDVQVSNHTLQWLSDNLNRTEHGYNYTNAGGELVTKTYLLDINPHHVDVGRGDGSNIIDGRWIDSDNGIFIDITGVREREADRPGFWTCKNKHRYASEELWPLHITKFEGVRCRVPYNFQKILADEYGAKSLVTEEYVGLVVNPFP